MRPPGLPETALPMIGAVAALLGVAAAVRPLAAPVPTSFTAATSKVYAVPLVSPVTVASVVAEPFTAVVLTAVSPSKARTRYPVRGTPPVSDGAVQETVTERLPVFTDPTAGAAGAPAGVTGPVAAEAV